MQIDIQIRDEDNGSVSVRLAFQPELTPTAEITGAGTLASEFLVFLGEYAAERGGTVTARELRIPAAITH